MAGFVLAAAVLGMGIVFHVLGWTALSSEAGGNCGRSSRPCPQGLTGVLLLAFGCTFAGLGGLAFVDSALEKRGALPRRRRWSAIIAVVGVLAGVWPGVLAYDGLRGQFLEVRWSAPLDRPAGVTGAGSWVDGDLVVRARADRLVGYTTTGTAWTTDVPGREALCTMSRDVADGVGLVAWAADGRPCATVVAIDLRTGKTLWQLTRAASDHRYGLAMAGDELAVTSGLAVFTEATGLRAVGLREHDERWRLDVEPGCAPAGVAASAGQVVMLVSCENAGVRVVVVDPASGRERRRAEVPVEPPMASVELLSARPVVVRAVQEGSRTEDVVISFDDEGQVQARIPRSGPDYDMPPVEQTYWRARPVHRPVVRDDLLIAPVSAPGEDRRTAVAAFSLKTGTQLWRTAIDGDVVTVEPTTGGLVVATNRLHLNELSPTDGTLTATLPVRGEWWVYDVDLRKVSDGYAVMAFDGTKEPPVVMVG
ncbi:outer membrane protein assembly factor BamB family protein [Amycolatopsis sp. NPDC004747]